MRGAVACGCNRAGPQQVSGIKRAARSFQAETREGLVNNAGEIAEIVQQPGKKPDIENLAHQPRQNRVAAVPKCPEEPRERYIDADQNGR